MKLYLDAAKRLAVVESEWLDDWYISHSPRNGNEFAEGTWCQWVHLARLILADPRTTAQMPGHHQPYEPPDVYADHHPDCVLAAATGEDD